MRGLSGHLNALSTWPIVEKNCGAIHASARKLSRWHRQGSDTNWERRRDFYAAGLSKLDGEVWNYINYGARRVFLDTWTGCEN